MRAAFLLCALLLARVPASAGLQRDDDPLRDAPIAEGPLDNDVVLPVSEPAAEALRRGDAELEKSRTAESRAQSAEAQRLLESAFEAWREALVAGGGGSSLWFPLPSAGAEPGRLTEGVLAAVRRRLASLGPEQRASWTQRYEATAESALAAAGDDAALIEVLRLHPLTKSAARAALRLCDRALEAGLAAGARGWLERGVEEARSCAAAELLAAFEARRGELASHESGARASELKPDETWARASSCDVVDMFMWQQQDERPSLARADPEGGVRPGLVFLSQREFALQTPDELVRLALLPDGKLERLERLRPVDLLAGFGLLLEYDGPRDPPGWPLLPLADGAGLVLVLGRGTGAESNALVSLEFTRDSGVQRLGLDVLESEPPARLRWAMLGADHVDAALERSEVPGLLDLGNLEFQPGPVLAGDLVIVQAREYAGQVRAWLLAFDRRDGTLAWKRLLASGADRVVAGRFAGATRRVASQAPLGLTLGGAPCVFAGTHLGASALVDALSGELSWTLKNRRRNAREPGWNGDRPALSFPRAGEPSILWAPMDSDRMYFLRTAPIGAGDAAAAQASAALFTRPPMPLNEATALLGGDEEELVMLGSSGKERNVSARRAGEDRRDALDLAPDEHFRGQGLLSPRRAWVSTDRGVYLLDRERELYLLDFEALRSAGSSPPGGDLFARGDLVLVLGQGALWSLRAR